MLRISTLDGHKRQSTQELLQKISEAVENGEREFYISASGQHDIGGPLWNREGKPLRFTIINPGQRVGSMCMANTHIIVEGPVPADAGWLNSGGTITIKGDAGDTAGHCAAGGKIFIGGRAGTRSGSLMKHDPEMDPPELWILGSTGSFSFEFMSGGKAIVCGHDSQTLASVLGERPCVGMVGGVVYFRGPCAELPEDVEMRDLTEADIKWLDKGLDAFLDALGEGRLKRELSLWKHWRKLVPAAKKQSAGLLTVADFRSKKWIEGGIFGDVLEDDLKEVAPLVATGEWRLRLPMWENCEGKCRDCKTCVTGCPQNAIRRRTGEHGAIYFPEGRQCVGCGMCAALCPCGVWKLVSA